MRQPTPTSVAPHSLDGTTSIIVYISIDCTNLVKKKRQYPWPRLSRCPGCGGVRVWGHGYVLRYFDDHPEGLYLKRYRCADCGGVHTARPDTHYRGFWASIACILDSLLEKALHNSWCSTCSRQRQQYWWRGFVKQASRRSNRQGDSLTLLFTLMSQSIILATHSLEYCEIQSVPETAHLIFAVTPPTEYG